MYKKILLIIIIIFLTFSISATRSVLIDFDLLKANGNGYDVSQSLAKDDPQMTDYTNHDFKNRTQHMPTLVDYSIVAGTSFSEDQKKAMLISLSPHNWDVDLNSSASHINNIRYCVTTEWHSKFVDLLKDESHPEEETPEGYTIMAIRVKFPTEPYNAWAIIKPPFNIPAYESVTTDYLGNQLDASEVEFGTKFENGYGVIKNVGEIKRIEMRVYGLNYKNSVAIQLEDDNMHVKEYHFGEYLDYDGWRNIKWDNPNYIENVAHRDLFIVPLYPKFEPYIKLHSFRIYRPGDQLGGDFITYIKDVYVTYDEAVLDRSNEPVQHEPLWRILEARTLEVKKREISKLGFKQILRYLEKLKIHQEPK